MPQTPRDNFDGRSTTGTSCHVRSQN